MTWLKLDPKLSDSKFAVIYITPTFLVLFVIHSFFLFFFFGHYFLGQPYSFPKDKFSVDIKIGKWAEYRVKLDLFHLF